MVRRPSPLGVTAALSKSGQNATPERLRQAWEPRLRQTPSAFGRFSRVPCHLDRGWTLALSPGLGMGCTCGKTKRLGRWVGPAVWLSRAGPGPPTPA